MMRQRPGRQPAPFARALIVLFSGVVALTACAEEEGQQFQTGQNVHMEGNPVQQGTAPPIGERRAFIRDNETDVRTGRTPVNGYLWRAALDTASFMPLVSADAIGGVIITDWYAPPETPDQRLKLTVLVRGAELESEGVKVTVFRQVLDDGGQWVDSTVDSNTQTDMENIILSQARVLRSQARSN